MDSAPDSTLSPQALGTRLLKRLTTPLRLAGWNEEEEEWYEEEVPADAATSMELSRSNFHLHVSWHPARGRLVVDDPTDGWDWAGVLPPLFPLDEPLSIDLGAHPTQAAKAEAARRAFAAAGLLDTTRIHRPQEASVLRHDLVLMLWAEHIHETINRHRRDDDAGAAIKALGEEFSWRIGSGLRAYPVIVPDAVPTAAARGIAEWCWRRESDVEEWHFKIGDIAMARANIAATRAALPHVHPEGVDWPAVRLALTAPSRRLASGQGLQEIFEEGWAPILASIHREIDFWQQVDESLGPEATLRLLSMHGSHTESIGEWWGSGWYETMVRRAVARAASDGNLPAVVPSVFTDAEQFADAAAGHPDLLDDETLSWLTKAVFEEGSFLRNARLPSTVALTLPDWAVQDLLSFLPADDEAT
ncbi:hypothetical protein GCM10022244_11700 [Streptomyces gulbargensis]|uniref:Uncharacterized protein n=1 Tax=Streptomyces gulbargensis TaxID=364901 RepID=A0ABP7LJL9_9ACTN